MKFIFSGRRAWHVIIIFVIFIVFLTHNAAAYQVSPLHHYLTLTGKGATSSLVISNSHDYPLTVELTIQRREISGGKVQRDVPADEDFLIFPPQAIIQPGKKQRVQIRYVGDTVERSELYRLVVAQVPVTLEESETAKVNVAYNFISAVYVAPKGAKAKLSVGKIQPATTGGFDVAVTNQGNYHALLPNYVWTGSDGSQDMVINPANLPLGEEPFIEPGGERTLTLSRKALGDLSTLSSLKITPGKDQNKRPR